MAALLKSREAVNAKPRAKMDGPAEKHGTAAPAPPKAKEEMPNASAPGYGLVAVMAKK
jgi:hypothetical protein